MKKLTLDKRRLKKLLLKNTQQILQKANSVRSGHIGGSVSMSQFLLPILYYLEIENSINYRLVLSKGHASLGLYSILSLLNINNFHLKTIAQIKLIVFMVILVKTVLINYWPQLDPLDMVYLLQWDILMQKN